MTIAILLNDQKVYAYESKKKKKKCRKVAKDATSLT